MKSKILAFFKHFKKDKPQPTAPHENGSKKETAKKLFRTVLNIERLPFYFILSLLLVIVIECFARRSLGEGLLFPFQSFIPFLTNYALILLTLLPTLLLKHRISTVTLISAAWLSLGVTQFVLLSFRVTPLTAVDFSILGNVITILDIYLSMFEIILIAVLILAAIAVIVLLFIKMPKVARKIKKCALAFSSTAAATALLFLLGFGTGVLSDSFPNLTDAYDDYGFTYCFTLSVFDKGIDKPENYSQKNIEALLEEIEAGSFDEEEDTPNIIFVQLESLFDVNRLKDITFSENPLPHLTELKSRYENGLLTVPVIGAGTVNTEFEVLTGMSVNHFGPGEYPYKSILKDKTCETIAYTLAESGYTAHAIHNHQGTFYARNEVYKNLGFSSFTPLEYMLAPEYNETEWAKDMILVPEIFEVLNSTQNRDFVFTVSVQTHGKYSTDYSPEEGDVVVTAGIDDEERLSQYNYYLKQLRETDAFVGALTEAILAYDEPTVLLFYGDHLPALSIENEMLNEGTIYETEYLLVSNYNMKVDKSLGNLHAYQLYPTVMKLIGNENGIVNRFHQVYQDREDYLAGLEILEYDLLYGEGYALQQSEPYPTMDSMRLGVRSIVLESYSIENDILTVKGQNFTPYSQISLDGDEQETTFVDNNTLTCELSFREDHFSALFVEQRTAKGEVLTSTEAIAGPKRFQDFAEETELQ